MEQSESLQAGLAGGRSTLAAYERLQEDKKKRRRQQKHLTNSFKKPQTLTAER